MAVICERFDTLGADGCPARLGIMGGTFDPLHIGHLICADQACTAFNLDGVVFVPAGTPVFKKDREITAARHRLEMCRIAVQDNPIFDVSSIEIDRGGDTYTVDTLRQMRAYYPSNVELCLIVGSDAAEDILSWRESALVAALARLIVVMRPGSTLSQSQQRVLVEQGGFTLDALNTPALSVSSSELRQWLKEGRSVRYVIPQNVVCYIQTKDLYESKQNVVVVPDEEKALSNNFLEARREDLLRRLKPSRYKHSVGVEETASSLALLYGVDVQKARLAGLLHDWDKSYSGNEALAHARSLGIAEAQTLATMPHLLHGPTAAAWLAYSYPDIPSDVLRAIKVHTVGSTHMTDLDMVVYVADAIEPGRLYEGVEDLRDMVGRVSLKELFVATLKHTFLDLIHHDREICPCAVEVWNHFVSCLRKDIETH